MSSDYSLRPPPRVSFATSDLDAEAAFKVEVLERVHRARWNTYVGLDQRLAAEAFTDRLGINRRGARRASLHRGAEAALRRLIEQAMPARLWAPAHGYPGFARVASSARVPLLAYANPEELEGSRSGDLVVVTSPSSPVPAGDVDEIIGTVERTGAGGVIDATFSLLDPDGVAELDDAVHMTDMPVIISASKSLGLAGIRMGVLLHSESGPEVLASPMELDVFQCAVWETLMDADRLRRRADTVGTHQRELHRQLRHALEHLCADVLYAANSFALTVSQGSIPESVLGDRGWKEYPRLHALRLDASDRVLSALNAFAGAPR